MHTQVHTLEAQKTRYFTQPNHAKHMPALTLPRKSRTLPNSFTTDNQTLVATSLMPSAKGAKGLGQGARGKRQELCVPRLLWGWGVGKASLQGGNKIPAQPVWTRCICVPSNTPSRCIYPSIVTRLACRVPLKLAWAFGPHCFDSAS